MGIRITVERTGKEAKPKADPPPKLPKKPNPTTEKDR